jgi:hypothetical protein
VDGAWFPSVRRRGGEEWALECHRVAEGVVGRGHAVGLRSFTIVFAGGGPRPVRLRRVIQSARIVPIAADRGDAAVRSNGNTKSVAVEPGINTLSLPTVLR